MSEIAMTVEDARRKLRQYRDLRDQLDQMTPDVRNAARVAYAAGDIKADILRDVGWSRPWLNAVLDGTEHGATEQA